MPSMPPKWAPTAIATTRGWVDSKTGELLVANRHLHLPVKQEELNQDVIVPEKRKYNKRNKPNKSSYE